MATISRVLEELIKKVQSDGSPDDLAAGVKQLLSSPNAVVGSFKKIIPLDAGKALTVAPDLQELQTEFQMLAQLRDMGFNALQAHSQPIKVGDHQAIVIVDHIKNAHLLDAKAPGALENVILAYVTGTPLESNKEAGVLQGKQLQQKIARKIENGTLKITDIQKRANALAKSVEGLLTTMQTENALVGDLQLLLGRDGQLTIIDPLDVIKVDPSNGDMTSLVYPEKPLSNEFKKSLGDSLGFLQQIHKQAILFSKIDQQSLDSKMGVQTRSAPQMLAQHQASAKRQQKVAGATPGVLKENAPNRSAGEKRGAVKAEPPGEERRPNLPPKVKR